VSLRNFKARQKLTHQELVARAKVLEKELHRTRRLLEEAREKNIENEKLKIFYKVASFIAHDLKNSTSTLSLVVKNCMESIKSYAVLQRSFKTIAHEVERMRQLTDTFSNLPPTPELRFEKCDVIDLLQNALIRFEPLPSVQIVHNVSHVPSVRGDNKALETVFVNLIKNSLEAMSWSGRLTVTTTYSEGENFVEISIADTGLGISQSYLNNGLFKPFSTTKDRGLGIGLYQSKDIVERHGGQIRLKRRLNQGTECIINLPISQ
jgi:signal transduction histidine kinase